MPKLCTTVIQKGDNMYGWYFDIESDGFYLQAKKIWYIKFKSLDNSRSLSVHPFKEDCVESIKGWIDSFDDGALVVQHNGDRKSVV